jgi:hypothetical protein
MAQAKKALTDRGLKALKPAAPGKRYDRMDALVPGLGVRVTDKGHMTFILASRFPDKPKNYTRRELGAYGELTLEAARTKARRWLELIHSGIDPKRDEEQRQDQRLRNQKNTFAAVAEEFFKRKLSKTRKGREVERDIRREFVERWAARPIAEIDRHDVMAVIDAAVDRGLRIRLTTCSAISAAYSIGRSGAEFMGSKPHHVIAFGPPTRSARRRRANVSSMIASFALFGMRPKASAILTASCSAFSLSQVRERVKSPRRGGLRSILRGSYGLSRQSE